MSKASNARSVCIVVETCQPTTTREYTSRMNAAYTHPEWVRM
ncbi:Uncharacterised protein [Mycobacteroides abscessus subsp. abscessus]|nr:Uncharacterised protein [Mycobacteroides abscessus subsp. abscessus]